MTAGLLDLVFHPDAFFERVSKEKVNLILPFVIIMGAVGIDLIGHLLHLAFLHSMFASDFMINKISENIPTSLFMHTIWLIIIWIVTSLYLYFLPRAFGGRGSFGLIVQNTGYGMIPWTIFATGSILNVCISWYNYSAFLAPKISLMGYPSFVLQSISALGAFLWVCYLWTLAVRHTHQFTLKKSALVIGIPALVILIITWLPVLQNLPMLISMITGS